MQDKRTQLQIWLRQYNSGNGFDGRAARLAFLSRNYPDESDPRRAVYLSKED